MIFVHNILDLTPYGRQEGWEDSPPGWPRRPNDHLAMRVMAVRLTVGNADDQDRMR
jgi:hypothetical protein